ncbi:MAG: hypothetical protein PHE65_05355 [Candidatus Omnitrophica bacterium]|nr:hypothetical protein [Candidatus Omnitrophota bacterium]
MNVIRVVSVTVLVLIASSGLCAESVSYDTLSYEKFVAAHEFPYAAPDWRTAHIRDNYVYAAVGLDKDRVARLFGAPDYVQYIYPKAADPGPLGCSWVYVFAKDDSRVTNRSRDKIVSVIFDDAGLVRWIASSVEGLADIGGPG